MNKLLWVGYGNLLSAVFRLKFDTCYDKHFCIVCSYPSTRYIIKFWLSSYRVGYLGTYRYVRVKNAFWKMSSLKFYYTWAFQIPSEVRL